MKLEGKFYISQPLSLYSLLLWVLAMYLRVGKTISIGRMIYSCLEPHFSALSVLRRRWEMYLARLYSKDLHVPNI